MQPYAARRAEFVKDIGNGAAIIPAARTRLRNNDTEYEFRQDSDFYYLTGFTEPDAVLVLAPGRDGERTILFVQPRDRAQEIWTGKRHGVEGALAHFGVDAAYDIGDLDSRLPDYLVGADALYYTLGQDERFDRKVMNALSIARQRVRRGGNAPRTIEETGKILHEQRLFKTPAEVAMMRKAGEITRLGHMAAMRATRPGMTEYQLEAIIEHAYRTNGAQDTAYPSIVAGGDNATILHYNANREELSDGELVLVDSGCEYNTYASDVTRTWPVNGRFSPEQRAIYDIVLDAQKTGIDKVRAGNSYWAYHEAAVGRIVDGLLELGLLRGSRNENIETQKYRDYYMHNTGHWIGLDVHDVGRYREDDGQTYRVLAPGMVMTVEPGIYVHRDLECDERFKGIGVRIEDDILCTSSEPDNLSADIPKEVEELESIVGSEAALAAR